MQPRDDTIGLTSEQAVEVGRLMVKANGVLGHDTSKPSVRLGQMAAAYLDYLAVDGAYESTGRKAKTLARRKILLARIRQHLGRQVTGDDLLQALPPDTRPEDEIAEVVRRDVWRLGSEGPSQTKKK
jgi:hypothetical protein